MSEEPSLYAKLLGSDWEGLTPLLRRMHREGRTSRHLTIRRGRTR